MRHLSSHLLLTPCGLEAGKIVTVSEGPADGAPRGTVLDIRSSPHLDREAGVEFFAGVLMPGLFNAHCHLELSYLHGAIAPGGGFTAFARGMSTARHEASRNDAANFWDAKMHAEGVSAVADVCNGDSTFERKTTGNIRYRNYCELFGLTANPAHAFSLCNRALSAADGTTGGKSDPITYLMSFRRF